MAKLNYLTVLFLACLPCQGAAVAPIGAEPSSPDAVLRALLEVTHPGGKRLDPSQVDYDRLAAAIPPALELVEVPPGLWREVPIENRVEPRAMTLYGALVNAVPTAAAIAPTREHKEKWLRTWQEVVLRMLRDPRTQRAYAEKRNPENHASDYVYVATIQSRDLQGVRGHLGREKFLRPDDWGFYSGCVWTSEPGSVILRDKVVLVQLSALRSAGVPVETGAGFATAAFGGKRASIPIGASAQASARRGFRDRDGRVYLPVEEFHRQGVFAVDVLKGPQMVELIQEHPPEHPHGARR